MLNSFSKFYGQTSVCSSPSKNGWYSKHFPLQNTYTKKDNGSKETTTWWAIYIKTIEYIDTFRTVYMQSNRHYHNQVALIYILKMKKKKKNYSTLSYLSYDFLCWFYKWFYSLISVSYWIKIYTYTTSSVNEISENVRC